VGRPSVASLDSGAESPVYGAEPSVAADRMGPKAKSSWAGVPRYASIAELVVSAEPAWLPAPSVAPLPAVPQESAPQESTGQPASSDASTQSELTSQRPGPFTAFARGDQVALGRCFAPGSSANGLGGAVGFGGITSHQVPQGGPTRDIAMTVGWVPAQASAGVSRLARNYDMSVVDQQSGRWYVKDIRASTQPMGTQ
jgi:hypothetical protein